MSVSGREGPGELRGKDLTPILANHAAPEREAPASRADIDLSPVSDHPSPAPTVRDAIHFTYDDHQAATASRRRPGQPNRIRGDPHRDARSTPSTSIPTGRAPTEYEMYDLERDPLEVDNRLEVRSGAARFPDADALRAELSERLATVMEECGTTPPVAPLPG